MKEFKQPIYKGLAPIKMYLDDVQAIYNIIKNNCSSVKIKTDRYEISDVAQLKDIGVDEIHTLEFVGRDPYISVVLEPDNGRIYIDEDSTINRGILSQVQDILNKCKRKIARIFAKFYFPLVLGLIIGITFGVIGKFAQEWLIVSIVSGAIIYILAFVNSFRLSFHQYSTIILSERHERPNFLKRNKDQIIVGLIIAGVSVALTILAFKIFQWS